jgi:hypothetical protein
MVPLLRLQPHTIDRHKLLAMFSADNQFYRWDLTRPYIVGGHAYATDARVMARIITTEDEHDDESIKAPPVERAWADHYQPASKWQPFRLSEHDQLLLTQTDAKYGGACPICDDRRVSYGVEYPTDEETSENLPDYDPDDNTIRDVSCTLCRGKPYYGGSHQRIASELIAYHYAKRLAKIPGCEVNISHKAAFLDNHTAILFRSEVGIAGVVSPVTDQTASPQPHRQKLQPRD